jgi:microcystin-dependent protein
MSQAYLGEVRLVGFSFAPLGWFQCAGQSLAISQYSTLYSLIGTTYGGNGTTVFNLPDLQGRIPLHQGSNGVTNYTIGQKGGVENVTVALNQYPGHNHVFSSSSSGGGSGSPAGNVAGSVSNVYTAAAPSVAMNAAALGPAAGSSQPHENRQPYQVINWVICWSGIFPTQN